MKAPLASVAENAERKMSPNMAGISLAFTSEHVDGGSKIDGDHEWHERSRHPADPVNAAENHQADDDRQRNARNDVGYTEVKLGHVAHVPGLEHVAAGDHRDQQRDAEQAADQLAEFLLPGRAIAERLADDPHRAAVRIVGVAGIPVEHCQRDFDGLERHAEETDHPHPEHRARSAQADGERHTADVAETNRRRQRGRQRLEVIDGARVRRIVVAAAQYVQAVRQRTELAEARPEREGDPRAEHEKQDCVVPEESVGGFEKAVKTVQVIAPRLR